MSTDAAAPRTLQVVFGLVLVEAALQSGWVVTRDDIGPAGRGLLVLAFATKVAMAELARRRSAAGVLGLAVFESVGILVAIGADWHVAVRIALIVQVGVVLALLARSMHAFPSPELPAR